MNQSEALFTACTAIGGGYLAASLTPGIEGPGWIAFGVLGTLWCVVHRRLLRRRR